MARGLDPDQASRRGFTALGANTNGLRASTAAPGAAAKRDTIGVLLLLADLLRHRVCRAVILWVVEFAPRALASVFHHSR
jgi:hypothetical protein